MLSECKNNYKDLQDLIQKFGRNHPESKICESCPHYSYYPNEGLITCDMIYSHNEEMKRE